MTRSDVLKEALKSAQAAWTGCDWDTEFGPDRENLRGLCCRQARLAAQATRGDESDHWREVSRFLDAVEQDARMAAESASAAVEVWILGNVTEALRRLDSAIALEARYREPVAYLRLRSLMRQSESHAVDAG